MPVLALLTAIVSRATLALCIEFSYDLPDAVDEFDPTDETEPLLDIDGVFKPVKKSISTIIGII